LEVCLLDTCAVLDLMRGHLPAKAAVEPFDRFLTAFAVVGELVHGAYGSRNFERELARVETWLGRAQIANGDSETAHIYGEVIAELQKRGRRIPTNDAG
jgi:predicted nucleic acid-binding protein